MFKAKKTLTISERDPEYKVRYLGNVLTGFVKGDGCVDRPTQTVWNNYLATSNNGANPNAAGLEMELTVCNAGLKVVTKEQGLTEYRSHRITYSVCPDKYPKLFVWVYKHEGRKMKSEVRCHAVLCKSEAIASAIARQLHERLCNALDEYMREKRRRQNARIVVKRNNSIPADHGSCPGGGDVRTKFLKTGQNFKPSIDRSTSAPKLGSITEGDEEPDQPVPRGQHGYHGSSGSSSSGCGGTALGRQRGSWSTFPEINEDLEDDPFDYSNGTSNGNGVPTRFSTGSGSDVITSIANGLSATQLASHTTQNNVAIEDMVVVMKPRPLSGEIMASGDEEGDNDSVESGFSEQDASPLEAL